MEVKAERHETGRVRPLGEEATRFARGTTSYGRGLEQGDVMTGGRVGLVTGEIVGYRDADDAATCRDRVSFIFRSAGRLTRRQAGSTPRRRELTYDDNVEM